MMPCYDPDAGSARQYARIAELQDDLNKVEAMLCAIIDVLHKHKIIGPIVEEINAKEAGITANDIAIWWRDHKVKDAMRKRKEEEK